MAAAWKTNRLPFTASATASRSRTSASMHSTSSPSRLLEAAPGWRSTATDAPRSMSTRVTAEPMNPPAPVTSTRSPGRTASGAGPGALTSCSRGSGASWSRPLAVQRALGERLAELEDERGVAVRVVQHVVERLDEVGDLRLADDERRQQLDHVHVVGGDLGEDAVAVEERADDQLREEPLAGALHHLPA